MNTANTLGVRVEKARQLMHEAGVDLMIIGPSADFRYLTGHAPHLSERLTALVIPGRGQSSLVVPRLEASLYADLADQFDLVVWGESEPPLDHVAEIARANGVETIIVNDQLWSGFLLQLQQRLPKLSYQGGQAVLSKIRIAKDQAEIDLLKEASRRTDNAWEEFSATSQLSGRTEREVAQALQDLMAIHGMPSLAFCIVASGPNGSSPHHHTGERVIQPGDPVVIDFGGDYQGYYSDITRTPVAGEPHPEFVEIYGIVLEAQQAAFEAIHPGVPAQEIDRAARRVITDHGYGDYFIHRVGHGLGLTVHEDPYLVEGNTEPLTEGMVVSDEPGIYIPGRWGVRIEDSVVVTSDGAERINHVTREIITMP